MLHHHDHPLHLPLALAGALAGAGVVLPDPANVTAFLGALGLGLGIGLGALIERVGRARARAFKEWDEAHRSSTQAQLEEARRQLELRSAQVDENTRDLLAIREKLDSERGANERLRHDLQEFAISVLRERGYIAQPDPTEPTR